MCCTQQMKLAVLRKRQQEHTVPVETINSRVRTCMSFANVLTVVYKLSALHLISTQFCCKHPGMLYLSYSGQRWH